MFKHTTATIFKLLIAFVVIALFTPLFSNKAFAQSANAGSFNLSPETGRFDHLTYFQTDIKLVATNLKSAKAVLTYDVTKLEVLSLANGTMFDFYDPNIFDNTLGKITFSGKTLSSASTSNVFGTVTFKAKTITSIPTQVIFDATTTATNTSDIAISLTNTKASYTIVQPLIINDIVPTQPGKLPNTGVLDELIIPFTLGWGLIVTFLIIVFFKTPKDDILKRVLNNKKK